MVMDPAVTTEYLSRIGAQQVAVIAPVAQTALYSTINGIGATSGHSGGYVTLGAATAVKFATGSTTELAANTLNLDTCASMVAALDASYLDGAAFYFSSAQWAGMPGKSTPRATSRSIRASTTSSTATRSWSLPRRRRPRPRRRAGRSSVGFDLAMTLRVGGGVYAAS
jgi:hypothetical protein